jgi:O-antigen ligase
LAQYLLGRPLGLYALGETSAETTQILSLNSVEGERVWRVSAFMWHPNIFGAFLGAVLAMALALTLVRTFPFGRVYFFFAFLLGIPALLATESRSGWLCFAVSCSIVLLLSIFHRRLQKKSLAAIPVLLVTGLCLLTVFSGKITDRLFHSKEDATIGREAFQGDAKRMIAEKPIFGWGLNTYSFEVEPFMKFTVQSFEGGVLPPVHNIYLLVLAETGVVGFAFHAIMFGMLFWHAYGNLRVRNDLLYMVNAACIAGLAAVLVDGNFSFTWRMNGYQKAFWVFAAMVMAIYYWRLRHELPKSGAVVSPEVQEQTVAAG